jgi:hypothetical protein
MIDLHDVARELNDDPVAEPTPVDTIYRRAATLRRRSLIVRLGSGALAVGAVVVVTIAIVGTRNSDDRINTGPPPASQPPSVSAIGWPSTFVSTRPAPGGNGFVVAVSDARTGALLKTIAEIPSAGGTNVTGTAITRDGHVWVTLNRGPSMTGHIAGGGPIARTCSSEVRDYDPKNGTYTTVLRGGDNELISDVQPNPTDDRVAYTHSGCATYYFDASVQVKNLRTGDVVTIGAGLPRCHFIQNPRWTQNGTGLVFSYAKASTPHYDGPNGTCSDLKAGAIVVVSAQRSQPGVDGSTTPADPGCSINAATVTDDGYAALEQCGTSSFIIGPVRLLRYDGDLRPLSRVSLGRCQNGASIAGTTKSSDVVISMYQFCGANALPPPATNVFVAGNAGVRKILAIPGGDTALDHLSY